ncbi:MAG TPA: c-type cytochrome [Candidatus Binatia bacterium]|nr:c-type cytochrome [Candidatus Binatia bacterium]
MSVRALAVIFLGAVLASARAGIAAEPIQTRLAPCLACHGAQGRSETPLVPSLGGQPEFYLSVQLLMFREKIRDVPPMTEMLHGVGDADLQSMAASLARLPPTTPLSEPMDRTRIDRARALIEQHRCNFCHKVDFSGGENVPRLAGQREDYIAKALRDYKSNARRGYDASMADVLYPLSDTQLLDLAYFLSHQP